MLAAICGESEVTKTTDLAGVVAGREYVVAFPLARRRIGTRTSNLGCRDRLRVHRYYDPVTGQFLSIDPELATTNQPYVYTGDDPVNVNDPTGEAPLVTHNGCQVNVSPPASYPTLFGNIINSSSTEKCTTNSVPATVSFKLTLWEYKNGEYHNRGMFSTSYNVTTPNVTYAQRNWFIECVRARMCSMDSTYT